MSKTSRGAIIYTLRLQILFFQIARGFYDRFFSGQVFYTCLLLFRSHAFVVTCY